MNAYLREYQNSKSRETNVIPFPLNSTASSSETNLESLLSNFFSNPEVEEHLKGIFEAAVLDTWLKARLFDIERVDNPFDAIYISELKADYITTTDINRVLKYSDIIDLSDTISFADEWEE